MSFNNKNRTVIKTHGFMCHVMTAITYLWLKPKIHPKKVPVMTKNTLMQAVSFISIYSFCDISSIALQHLYLTQLIYKKNHLRKFVDSIC